MPVSLERRKDKLLFILLILGTIVGVVGSITWYDGPLIEEVLLMVVVLLAAVFLYDRLFMQ